MLETPLRAQLPKASTTLPDPFVFVPITQQEAAKGRGAAKRIVRAHVTRVQHAKSNLLSGQDLQSWTVKPYLHRDSAPVRRKTRVATSQTQRRKRRTTDAPPEGEEAEELNIPKALIPVPKLTSGGGKADPFWSYPVDYKPNLGPIIGHYIENIAVEIPDLDGPFSKKGVLRHLWFPLAMTEAATMYAVLLMAASHFCIFHPEKATSIDVLALKARALAEINGALANPNRAVSDAMIGAVMKMAAYEAVFGESQVFAAHMKGLQMMLKIRGGLSTLGLNGLLERMLVWIDLNASHLIGTSKVLGNEVFPTTVYLAAPDPYHFAGVE